MALRCPGQPSLPCARCPPGAEAEAEAKLREEAGRKAAAAAQRQRDAAAELLAQLEARQREVAAAAPQTHSTVEQLLAPPLQAMHSQPCKAAAAQQGRDAAGEVLAALEAAQRRKAMRGAAAEVLSQVEQLLQPAEQRRRPG